MYKCFSSGLLGSNTYVLWDSDSCEGAIIDLGNPSGRVVDFCHEAGIAIKYLILTHAHYDHAEYLAEYRRAFPTATLVAHKSEVSVMTDAEANVSIFFGRYSNYGAPDMTVSDGDILKLGESEYRVISTPGHTPGSICLYNEKEKLVFTGDTLFMAGRGRCDFKGGSEEELFASLKRLRRLPPDTVVLSGHGVATTIGDEIGRVL